MERATASSRESRDGMGKQQKAGGDYLRLSWASGALTFELRPSACGAESPPIQPLITSGLLVASLLKPEGLGVRRDFVGVKLVDFVDEFVGDQILGPDLRA